MPKIMIIANPGAGNASLLKRWSCEIHPTFQKILGDFDYRLTQQKSDAIQFTQQALHQGYDTIVAMGGDGTINEVVNGFFNNGIATHPAATLGILPFGSGGDFVRTLQFERHYQLAALRLLRNTRQKIDVGFIKFDRPENPSRCFINIAEIGLGAEVMNHVNAKNKKWPSFLRYLTGTLQGFKHYKNVAVKIMTDKNHDQEPVTLTNLIIANGQYFGHGMRPAPNATLDDGLFDVLIAKDMGWLSFLLNLPRLYGGKHKESSKTITTCKTDFLKLTLADQTAILETEVDGEVCGNGSLTVRLLPKALNLIV